jgi:hypothetical protein
VATFTSAPLVRWLGAGATATLLACQPNASPGRREAPPSQSVALVAPPSEAQRSPSGTPDTAPTLTASAPRGPAARGSTAGAERFAFDFEDAELPELVRLIGAITGKRFILTGKLPAVHATVRSPEPVTADEAYGAFLSILQANGLTVVQSGEFWRILPSPGVPTEHGAGP